MITTLVIALTHKPHNIFLVPILLFTCHKINQACTTLFQGHSNKHITIITQFILHLWIGKQFYFYQGNSNSLASIDLNAGYVGLKAFNIYAVGTLLTLNTYSSPILAFLSFIYNSYDYDDKLTVKDILPFMAVLLAFPFILYVFFILLFTEHIFIWSVFSPKLLYESYYLCLMFVMWFLTLFIPLLN